MATQTGSIDLKAAKKSHDDAAKVATDYVSDTTNGILVHPVGDSDNGVKITDKVEIMRGSGGSSASVAEFGTSARIGENTTGKTRTEIGASGMQIIRNVNGTDTQIANLGFGEGADGSGQFDAPYFTFGKRFKPNPNYYTYDSSATYDRGDICLYDGDTYMCVHTISTPEQWTASHWLLATGNYSVAEGQDTFASGYASHAEGNRTMAKSDYCHAEGNNTTAGTLPNVVNTRACHAEGYGTTATGFASHAQNTGTETNRKSQTVIGEFNIVDTQGIDPQGRGQFALIIGNGTDYNSNARSDALEVDWYGDVFLALDTAAASGTDHDLYAAINALGWASDVIV